jgi:hypothetical protein
MKSELIEQIRAKIGNDTNALRALSERLELDDIELARYFNIKSESTIMKKDNNALKTAFDLLSEGYSKLTVAEQEFVNLVESKNKSKLFNQVKIIESYASKLKNNKEKALALECVKVLKENIRTKSIKEASFKTVEFKHTVKSLFEDQYYGGFMSAKAKDLKFLKNIKIEVLAEEKDSPETIYVTFDVDFFPVGNDFSSVHASLLALDKGFGNLGRKLLNATIYRKERVGQVFTGEGIWDASVRLNAVSPGEKANGKAEWVLHLVAGSVNSLSDCVKAVAPILKETDELIGEWFEEASPAAQKNYLKSKGSDEDENKRLANLKRQMNKLKSPVDDIEKDDDNYGGFF